MVSKSEIQSGDHTNLLTIRLVKFSQHKPFRTECFYYAHAKGICIFSVTIWCEDVECWLDYLKMFKML